MNWKGCCDWTYKFCTEDGFFEITYPEYLGDFPKTHEPSELMVKCSRYNHERENLYLGRTILSYDKKWLKEHRAEREAFQLLEKQQIENPLQFYCPNGVEMLAMLNDTEHDVKGMISPNRVGKTTAAWIDVLLDVLPCDPSWKIFTEHGVKWRPFVEPKDGFTVAVASYEKNNLETTIWPQVIKLWTPKYALGDYVQNGKRRKVINFKDTPKIQTDALNVYLMYYSMAQTPFESQAVDRFLWDEQGEEAKFDGADERLRTRHGRHVFSLTPHKVEGRPDTGAGTWIHDLDKGESSKGHNIKFYKQSMLDGVPDWIYPEVDKLKAWEKWVAEPERRGDRKRLKEGRSRLFGDWHDSGGLVYDEWDREVHLVDPFKIPAHWTKYRAMDWGRVKPTACLWGAVNPEGDLYIYDSYLKENAIVSESAKAIIEKSGNKRKLVENDYDPSTGDCYKRYDEVQCGNVFYRTVLDGRSIKVKSPNSSMTLGRLFQNEGLMVTPACTDDTYLTVPIVKEWLNPDYERENPHTGKMGRPKVFVFRTLTKFINHIEHYVNKEVTRKNRDGSTFQAERPVAIDDHDLDAFRYMIMIPPRYVEGASNVDDCEEPVYTEHINNLRVDSFTGY